jgi:hypothetical protein
MNSRERAQPTSPRKLWEAVSEVAQCGAGRYGEYAERSYGNARACIEAVQQQHESSDGYDWDHE